MKGPLLVALAAALWATDALFRYPATASLSAPMIVLIEHLIALIVLCPLVLFLKTPLRLRNSKNWTSALLVGAGGSALATIFFTQSFLFLNPTAAILLQKLQPIVVILLAQVFLGEHPRRSFYPWAALALVSALGVSLSPSAPGFSVHGTVLAATAALLWGIATIAGKSLIETMGPTAVTFWRYSFGALASLVIVALTLRDPGSARASGLLLPLIYIGLGPGLLALLLYYQGLKRTSASIATVVELIFPLSAVLLNWLVLGVRLTPVQLVSGVVLIFAVTKISQSTNN